MIILDFFYDYDGNLIIVDTLIVSLLASIVLFFVSRPINLWYWRIDDSIKNQEDQIRLLKKLAGEEVITEAITESTPWECIKCEHQNPNTTYQCENCDYSLK